MDLPPAVGDVELYPDREKDAEAARLVEDRPLSPPVGGERVVVGDGERTHTARDGLGNELPGVQLPVARARVEVEVG